MEPESKKPRMSGSEPNTSAQQPLLDKQVVILDGGCGLELKKRKSQGQQVAYNLDLFSTAALLETPDAVRQLHEDYAEAGAQVLTTATFAITKQYLKKRGLEHKLQELAVLAVALAREAADGVQLPKGAARPLVAGSVPPLSECYRVDLVQDSISMAEEYRLLTTSMVQAPGLDLWLCETMSTVTEAKAAVGACRAAKNNIPVWVGFVLKSSSELPWVQVMDGTSIIDAANFTKDIGAQAILFNCSTPRLIGLAVDALKGKLPTGLQLGGYGNFWDEHRPGWSIDCQESESGKGDQKGGGLVVTELTTEEYLTSAHSWVDAGATIVGGCCGIGPCHIKAISTSLFQSGQP